MVKNAFWYLKSLAKQDPRPFLIQKSVIKFYQVLHNADQMKISNLDFTLCTKASYNFYQTSTKPRKSNIISTSVQKITYVAQPYRLLACICIPWCPQENQMNI